MTNAKEVGDQSKTAKVQSQNILNESYALIERHDKFLNPTGIKSIDVALKVNEVILLKKTRTHNAKMCKILFFFLRL